MTVTAREISASPVRRPRTWRSVALLGGLTVLAAAPFVVGLVVPYYGNGLDAVPPAELSSGAHDPKDLPWPAGSFGGLVHVAGWLALAFTPMALIGIGLLSLLATPTASALVTWRLD